MKAVLRKTLTLKTDYKVPECSRSDLRVQIKAAAINPVDYKFGWPIFGPVSGLDFCGVVDQVGSDVQSFKVGDEVYGVADGSLAEYSVVKPDKISHKPKSLTFAETAALPIAYLTSYQALRDRGGLKEGGRVLVIGASGGCGIAGVQLAKQMGASKIYGVCSGRNAELVQSLGAEVIDYTKDNLPDYFKADALSDADKFDVVYDTATGSGGGEDYLAHSKPLLCKGDGDRNHGQYVAINGGPSRWARAFSIGLPKNEHLLTVNANTEQFQALADLIDAANEKCEGDSENSGMKPVIKNCYAFTQENVTEAFELLKSRRAVGKLVFDMTK